MGEVSFGENDFGKTGGASGFDDVDDAADGAKGTVEGELADKDTIIEVGLEELTVQGEDGKGDRKVEKSTVFLELSRREINRNAFGWAI